MTFDDWIEEKRLKKTRPECTWTNSELYDLLEEAWETGFQEGIGWERKNSKDEEYFR